MAKEKLTPLQKYRRNRGKNMIWIILFIALLLAAGIAGVVYYTDNSPTNRNIEPAGEVTPPASNLPLTSQVNNNLANGEILILLLH
ncbi:MAG: hypothetical protein ACPGO5_03630 [Patescibacteria group bacterium]